MLEGLAAKTILITGAAGGIGAETARVCAGNGANLVLTDIAAPSSVAGELAERFQITASAHALDVRDRSALESLIYGLPQLDAVVANAAICPWDDWNDDGWDAVFRTVIETNVLGVVNLLRPSMSKMAATGGGKIVLISSVAARMGGLKASPHYVASKGAVSALLKWFARKGAEANINVNCVSPGATATPMTDGAAIDTSGVPLRRMANPRDVALSVAFLCSDGANYMCGATLDVNGGVYMG
jgi:NAD(P)-dependent dehydrogenase (short-subunit alcohol dehydrogenase family)